MNNSGLVSILRERINDAPTLHLIRSFLKSGVMENGLESWTEEGVHLIRHGLLSFWKTRELKLYTGACDTVSTIKNRI